MAHKENRYVKVAVTFERRPDGGLRVYSDDVPGLMLSGSNADAVVADVIPALETLFAYNRKMSVKFGPVSDIRSFLEDNGWLLKKDVETREYVAPLAA